MGCSDDISFESLKYKIKNLEICDNITISYILKCRCRMFSEQLKIASQTLTYMCLFMSSYFLNMEEKIYI